MPRGRPLQTLFAPLPGTPYSAKILDTSKDIKVTVLSTRDKITYNEEGKIVDSLDGMNHIKHRSPKGTPKGQEYFLAKFKGNDGLYHYVKFMNSVTHETCLDSTGTLQFLGVHGKTGVQLPCGSVKNIGIQARKAELAEQKLIDSQGINSILADVPEATKPTEEQAQAAANMFQEI